MIKSSKNNIIIQLGSFLFAILHKAGMPSQSIDFSSLYIPALIKSKCPVVLADPYQPSLMRADHVHPVCAIPFKTRFAV